MEQLEKSERVKTTIKKKWVKIKKTTIKNFIHK